MPRGRPKKKQTEPFKLVDKIDEQNKAPKCQNDTLDDTLENANDTLDEAKENNMKSTKGHKSNSKQYPLCTRCGKPISNTNPFRVNLAYLTSVASYHREVKEDVPILCNDCAKGLSDAVDKYLISGGAKKKFERDERE
jgi:hypothetical protein